MAVDIDDILLITKLFYLEEDLVQENKILEECEKLLCYTFILSSAFLDGFSPDNFFQYWDRGCFHFKGSTTLEISFEVDGEIKSLFKLISNRCSSDSGLWITSYTLSTSSGSLW